MSRTSITTQEAPFNDIPIYFLVILGLIHATVHQIVAQSEHLEMSTDAIELARSLRAVT